MIDYRFTKFERYDYLDIKDKKLELGKVIDGRVRKEENIGQHYSKISPKEGPYYNPFSKIYCDKCAYCGVTIAINTAPLYEVDHYYNKLQETYGEETISVNHIDNLIFSCKNCNQSKKGFEINDIADVIHPDNKEIKNVFKRGEYFEIKISSEYVSDKKIQDFYKTMKFNYRFRKLDYLLLNLYFMKDNFPKYEKLYTKLLEFRNSVPTLKKYK